MITTPDKLVPPFVKFTPRESNIDVSWGWNTMANQEEDGSYICYIPCFDIYFSAKNFDALKQKGRKVTRLYISHFIEHSSKGVIDFVLQLHKLGFKAPNDTYTIQRFIKKERFATNFKATAQGNIPKGFENASTIPNESELVANY